jgi:ABC-2 type transport system ATP-binding protein
MSAMGDDAGDAVHDGVGDDGHDGVGAALLAVRGITRRFGDRTVLAGVDLDVAAGEAVGVVGPNGSGKSTLLRCIVGTDEADAGTSVLAGRTVDEREPAIRRDLAVVMDDIDFFPDLSVVEHLELLAYTHGSPDRATVDGVLEALGLAGARDQLPATLSSGQRRRLALASCFVRPRRLLLLDEPEQRLDTAGRRWLADRLVAEKAAGHAVLLASHDPGLVAAVADDTLPLGT